MPKSYLEEAVAWLTEKEDESQEDMLSAEDSGDDDDYNYHHGRYEAYGLARHKIMEMLNGKD